MPSPIDRLRAKAADALRHKDLAWTLPYIPAPYRNSPAVIRSILSSAAAGDPRFADSEAYATAHGALYEWQRAEDLSRRVSEIYHDPAVQLAAGDKLDWYWAHPAAAKEKLTQMAASGSLPPALHRALDVVYEAQEFASENGIAEPAIAAKPLPANPDAEIADLVAKPRLTVAEDQRLDQLYAMRLEREERAGATVATPKTPGEFERLAKKSLHGLTADEERRLDELAGARAIASGQVDRDDIEAEKELMQAGRERAAAEAAEAAAAIRATTTTTAPTEEEL